MKPFLRTLLCLRYQAFGLTAAVLCPAMILFPAFSALKAEAESVKFVMVKESRPETLFLFPGRVSLLSLPCPVTKALSGSPNDIKAEADKTNPRDVHILLRKWGAQPSNLILKCSDRVFLFNLIPSRKSHYDYVQVIGHIKPPFKLKVKSPLPNAPSTNHGGLRDGADFKVRKVLDFSWGFNAEKSREIEK